MAPKEKAKDLVGKYRNLTTIKVSPGTGVMTKTDLAKEYALIAVDEILRVVISAWSKLGCGEIGELKDYIAFIYWNDVKKEIENL